EAEAMITVEDPEKAKEVLKQCEEDFRVEYEGKEDTVLIEVKEAEVKEVMDVGEKVIGLLMALPHGVLAMNAYIEGLVDTSTNLAVVSTSEERVEIYQNSRSSIVSALEDTRRAVEATGKLAGAIVEQKGSYPSWRPNVKSPLLSIAKDAYKGLFGVEPKVMAIHAGLETAVIGSKFPGMDMISIGPTVNFPHSPDERVHIGSVEKFYRYLKELLRNL
ncbi:MAG: M20/M25/M40 family metallo-hydrolase, partial [Thermoplasmata archaeon]|nr:M20/M25/M40 family metallo-hydrolase [Thermoplasmata archaeon]